MLSGNVEVVNADDREGACVRYNAKILQDMKDELKDLCRRYQLNPDYLDKLMVLVNDKLKSELIHLSIREGIIRLMPIILRALEYGVDFFDESLQLWVHDYRELEKNSTRSFQMIVNEHGDNIIRCLLQNSQRALTVYGDELDLAMVLKGYISDPYDPNIEFKSDHHYILPATPIELNAQELADHHPASFLHDRISKVIARCNGASNVHLRIPLNLRQNHWQLLKVTLSKDKIISAEVVDSLYSFNSGAAFNNIKTVVKHINKCVMPKVYLHSTGEQRNAYSCMDFVIRECLKSSPTLDIHAGSLLGALRDARDAASMRIMVMKLILAHHPVLRGEPVAPAAPAVVKLQVQEPDNKMECVTSAEPVKEPDSGIRPDQATTSQLVPVPVKPIAQGISSQDIQFISHLQTLSDDEKEVYLHNNLSKVKDYIALLEYLPPTLQFKLLNSRLNIDIHTYIIKNLNRIQDVVSHDVWIQYMISIKIIAMLSEYRDFPNAIHYGCVRELQYAVTKAGSLTQIAICIQEELNRMKNIPPKYTMLISGLAIFRQQLPLKNALSVGYKATLKRCLKLLNKHDVKLDDLQAVADQEIKSNRLNYNRF